MYRDKKNILHYLNVHNRLNISVRKGSVMVSAISNNQNSYPGLKTGTTVAALSGVGVYGAMKAMDAGTGYIARNARKQFASQTQTINELKNSFETLTKYGSKNTKLKEDILNLCEESKEFRKKIYNNASEMFNQRKLLKKTNIPKSLMIAIPFYIGAGAIVDIANNKQRANSEPNAETKNENPYVKVDMGKKLGLGLGLLCESGILALNKGVRKAATPSQIVSGMITAAVGGLLLGAITDKLSNKHAAKIADKNA